MSVFFDFLFFFFLGGGRFVFFVCFFILFGVFIGIIGETPDKRISEGLFCPFFFFVGFGFL